VSLGVLDRLIGRVQGGLDMLERTVLQALRGRIVLLAVDVLMDLAQELRRLVETARMIFRDVDGRMVFEVLAVINGGALDLAEGGVDLLDGIQRAVRKSLSAWR
jgi:hypothetical protein